MCEITPEERERLRGKRLGEKTGFKPKKVKSRDCLKSQRLVGLCSMSEVSKQFRTSSLHFYFIRSKIQLTRILMHSYRTGLFFAEFFVGFASLAGQLPKCTKTCVKSHEIVYEMPRLRLKLLTPLGSLQRSPRSPSRLGSG